MENNGFAPLGLHPSLVRALDVAGITSPTPIQTQAIPPALTGSDLIGIAQTGTGKTYAFGLPMLERLAKMKAEKAQGLIILPTRELALQVEESLLKVGKQMGVRTACLIGGERIGKQIAQLRREPHVIIATPGRLIDHLTQDTLSLANVRVLVLDEADRMLDMGFQPQIAQIMVSVPVERQTMLFSATMPKEIAEIAEDYLRSPLRIEVARAGTANEKVSQELIVVEKIFKPKLAIALAKEHEGETMLFFTRTKHGATRLCRDLQRSGVTAAELHADRTLSQRRSALDGFKKGTYRILVATDIAARGIDVTGIGVVVNYDVPENSEDYVHRIGRTGRAGREGMAISFATPEQSGLVRGIERLTRTLIPRRAHQSVPPADFIPGASSGVASRGRGRGPVRFDGGAQRSGGSIGASRDFRGPGRSNDRGPRATRTKSVNPRRAFEMMDSPERFDPRKLKRRPGKPAAAPKVKGTEDLGSFGEGEFAFRTTMVL